jgi:hypothetical protein
VTNGPVATWIGEVTMSRPSAPSSAPAFGSLCADLSDAAGIEETIERFFRVASAVGCPLRNADRLGILRATRIVARNAGAVRVSARRLPHAVEIEVAGEITVVDADLRQLVHAAALVDGACWWLWRETGLYEDGRC